MLIETDVGIAWNQGGSGNESARTGSSAGTDVPTGISRQLTLFDAGAEIFGPVSRSPTLFQVAFGVVRVCSVLNDGRRTITAFRLPGEIFGFEPEGHSFRAEAVEGVGLRTMPIPRDRALAGDLLRVALSSLVAAQEHLLVVGRQTAVERIAAFLIDMAERQKGSEIIDLPMPRCDIADYLALTPETVCRVFKQLREQGFVDFTSSRRVTVCNEKALKALVT